MRRALLVDILLVAVAVVLVAPVVADVSWRPVVATALLGVLASLASPPRRRRLLVAGVLFAGSVALADAALRRTAPGDLAERWIRVRAEWARPTRPADTPADACPHARFPDGDLTDGPPARDARGFRVLGPSGAPTVLVVGDSILHAGFADALHGAFAAAGAPLRVVDTSRPTYNLVDEACVAAEGVRDDRPDLVVVGHAANDVVRATTIDADLGGGPARYAIDSVVGPGGTGTVFPPLLLASSDPWTSRHLPALRDRWGARVVLDVQAPDLLARSGLAPVAEDREIAGFFDTLVTALADRPTIHLVVPMLHPRPNPVDAPLDGIVTLLRERGRVAADLRTPWAGLGVEHVGYPRDADLDRQIRDPLHPGAAGQRLIVDAVLAHADPGLLGGADVVERARRHALAEAERLLGGGPWRCAPGATPDAPPCVRP
jgi:hypothetical protein